MKCPKCQTDNAPDDSFCRKCGNKLEIVCTDCGRTIPPDSSFCPKCGQDLRQPAEAPPIDYSQPQSYTPKYLAEKILTTRSSIEGERKLVTVLFADVANYTSIAEKLDPEEVHQLMDGCFKILMDEIHRYEGTINQFTGDGVMALFGAPVAHEDHGQRACHAALSIQKAVEGYGEKIKGQHGAEFKLRIGLNSGPVIVGAIGNDLRMDYTALGDTTNLAARMQTAAEAGSILAAKDTYKMVGEFFEFLSEGNIRIKGKEEAQEAYKLIRPKEVESRFDVQVAKGLTKFVGRSNSMTTLMEAYNKAKSGSGHVIGLVGEAGTGKSRLLREMRARLAQHQITYLEGRCLHYGESMPYLPFLDIVRTYFQIVEGDREEILNKKLREGISRLDDALMPSVPAFQDLLSLKVDNKDYLKLEPKQKRETTFEVILNTLIRLSQDNTLIIALEDLHWIDKTSEALLDCLIGSIANAPILLILLYRTEYTNQWEGKSHYSTIRLGELTTESSGELVKAILGEAEVTPDIIAVILDRSSGNPLFIEELTYNLVENRYIQKQDDTYILSRNASEIKMPETIQGLIASRLDRLELALKSTLQVASVIGRDFLYKVLQKVSEMREKLRFYLSTLQDMEFIYEKNLLPELEYIFKHVLTQEVAYNSLLARRRKTIHEKIGKAIEDLYADRLEELYEMLAYHYSKSDDLEKASQYLRLSGEKAARSFSNWEAYRYYRDAINVLEKMPEVEENKRRQAEVLFLMTSSIHLLGYPEGSLHFFELGEKLSKELGNEKSLATYYSLIGLYHSLTGDPLGIKYNEESFKIAQKIQDVELVAATAQELSGSFFLRGECQKVVDLAPAAIHLLEKTQRQTEFFGRPFHPYSLLCSYCGYSFALLGSFDQAEALCEKSFRFQTELNDLTTLGFVEMLYGSALAFKGDGSNSLKHLANCARHFEEAQVVLLLGFATAAQGFAYYLLGEHQVALDHSKNGLDMHLSTGNPFMLSYIYWILAMNQFDLGDLKEAETCSRKAIEFAQQNSEMGVEGLSLTWLGRILARQNPSDTSEAYECILRGIKISEDLGLRAVHSPGYLFLGELLVEIGETKKALKSLKKAEGLFQEMGMEYWIGKTQEILSRL